jgi:hypothetical protein
MSERFVAPAELTAGLIDLNRVEVFWARSGNFSKLLAFSDATKSYRQF